MCHGRSDVFIFSKVMKWEINTDVMRSWSKKAWAESIFKVVFLSLPFSLKVKPRHIAPFRLTRVYDQRVEGRDGGLIRSQRQGPSGTLNLMIFKLVVQRCCRVKLKQKVLCSSEVHAGCCTSSPDVYWKLKEACKNKTHQQDKKDERQRTAEKGHATGNKTSLIWLYSYKHIREVQSLN